MEDKKTGKKKPIKITHMNMLTFGMSIFTGIVLVFAIIVSANAFKRVESTTQKYITCEEDAKLLQDASNYLTEQARLFVATGDSKYMDAYFTEANVTKRRENAVESLGGYFAGTDTMAALEAALDSSIALMNTEYLAMHAAAAAYGYNDDALPAAVATAVIPESFENPAELRTYAINLMAGDEYQEVKDIINDDVSMCMSGLMVETETEQLEAIKTYQVTQIIMIAVGLMLIVIMFIGCVFTYRNVVAPLKKHCKSIKAGEPLSVVGVAELQEVSVTFNKVYKDHQEALKIIQHEAEHDALTGVYNRRSFDKLLSVYEEGTGDYALLIMDVDFFKKVNDEFGHETGDKVLKKVADAIRSCFRNSDHVCRIGGDEFAVIVEDVQEKHIDVIKRNVGNINKMLTNTDDGLPPVTVSAGGALSVRRTHDVEKIFNEADGALYNTKRNGRNGCNFAVITEDKEQG